MTGKINSTEAGEVFRRFAWNLAGTLAKAGKATGKPRPATPGRR